MMASTQDTFGLRTRPRLADIARLRLDQEIARDYLQDIVQTAASWLDTPFAVADALLDHAQVFLAGCGPVPQWIAEAGGTPIEWAFCRPLVMGRTARTVADLSRDPMFADNPLVTIEGVRAYAGAPLISHRGQVIGGLCCLDTQPREFADEDLRFLQDLADEAMRRVENAASPDRPDVT